MTKATTISCILVLALGLAVAATAGAVEVDHTELVTQAEFVTGLYGAILGRATVDINPDDALQALQDRGVVPGFWDGEGNVKMVEAADVFHRFGVEIQVEDPDAYLTVSLFELLLHQNLGEIKKSKMTWDIVHEFANGLTIGQYRERILGPPVEGPVVSPSGF